jgi:hypothetical protein
VANLLSPPQLTGLADGLCSSKPEASFKLPYLCRDLNINEEMLSDSAYFCC